MKGEVLGSHVLHMATDDTVATAIDDLEAGTKIPYDGDVVELVDDVPFGHKIALGAFDTGEAVVKYGERIGRLTEPVESGEWIHTHNCESTRGRGDLAERREEVA
jgi:altronate dehydratase small subunit